MSEPEHGHDTEWGPAPDPDEQSGHRDPNNDAYDDELGAEALDDCGATDGGAANLEAANLEAADLEAAGIEQKGAGDGDRLQ